MAVLVENTVTLLVVEIRYMKWGREVLLDQREVDRDEWGALMRTRLR